MISYPTARNLSYVTHGFEVWDALNWYREREEGLRGVKGGGNVLLDFCCKLLQRNLIVSERPELKNSATFGVIFFV